MSKINRIQAAILALEGGAYQKLLDQYLHKKYHFENIQPLGVQNATNKSTKGIPDTYVLDGDKYILICYGTVKEQPVKKIQNDIEDCLNKAKTSLDTSKISKIICCYTSSNITAEQCETLKKLGGNIEIELIGIGTLSHDLIDNYRNLAADHLGISIDTHQIFEIDDFVDSYDRSGTNAPINTKFHHRNDELAQIIESINNNKITIVSGPSGIGKTRLCLEVCRYFKKDKWEVLCVRSNGESLYRDIEDYLDSEKKYLLFFDDVNTIDRLENVIETCFNLKKPIQVKILFTIRDYAKRQVSLKTNKFPRTYEIVIGNLKDEEIKNILKDNFNIQNHEYLNYICDISKGNIRLAILAGIRTTKSRMPLINNIEDIFRNYYDPIIDEIGIKKNDLIVLAIISFFWVTRITYNDYYTALINKYIGKVSGTEYLEKLSNQGLIDFYENEIVRISDQSLGNYILFLVIYKNKWIDLVDLIDHSFPHKTKLIVNLIDTLLSVFKSNDLESFIKSCINESWNNAAAEFQGDYLELFFQFNPLKGLSYIRDIFQNISNDDCGQKIPDFELINNSNKIEIKEIEILTRYKYTECFEDAMALLFFCYEKRPDLFKDFYSGITNHILFDKYSCYNDYSNEIRFMDLLWEKCKKGSNYNYSILYLRVADCALNTEFSYAETNSDNYFTFVRMTVSVDNQIKRFRSSIWRALISLYAIPEYHEIVYEILNNNHIKGLNIEKSKELFYFDYNELHSFLTQDRFLSFDKAMIIDRYRDYFLRLGMDDNKKFVSLNSCKDYILYKKLTEQSCFEYPFSIAQERRRHMIEEIIRGYSHEDYCNLFKTLSFFESRKDVEHNKLSNCIETLFMILEEQPVLYREVFINYLNNGSPYCIYSKHVIIFLFNKYGYNETKNLIKENAGKSINRWISVLLSCVPVNEINENISRDYFLFQELEFNHSDQIIIPLIFIQGYLEYNHSFLDDITNFLNEYPNKVLQFFDNNYSEENTALIMETFKGRELVLIDLYFKCNSREIDHDRLLFWSLYSKYSDIVWRKFITSFMKETPINMNNYKIFSRIWNSSEYAERMDYVFLMLIDNKGFLFDSVIDIIFTTMKCNEYEEKKKEWILNKLHDNIGVIKVVNMLFCLVTKIYPSWLPNIILDYLKYDKDVKNFKMLCLTPTRVCFESEIPIIDQRIVMLEEVKNALIGLEYIDHKDYLNDLINSEKLKREELRKREYMQKYSLRNPF